MAKTSPELENIDVRNQVLLERLKAAEHKKFEPFLRDIEKEVRGRLVTEGETITSKKRLTALLSDVTGIQRDIYDDYLDELDKSMLSIGIQQAEFEAKSYEKVTVNYESVVPSEAQVLAALRATPMQLQDYSGKQLLKPFTKNWSDDQIQRVSNTIQQGFYQGKTTSQIVREIRGTASLNFNDGDMAKVNAANRTIVRTAVQGSSTIARTDTMMKNQDLIKGYKWVSTLDSRTSPQCRTLDGQEFKLGKGPLPPIHPNCRSTTTPILSEKFDFLDKGATRPSKGDDGTKAVSTKQSYYSWLKTQPAAFQDDAIGPTRGKLLRNGGISADRFAKLQLDKNFEPLTLDEMRKKAPSVFEAANVD